MFVKGGTLMFFFIAQSLLGQQCGFTLSGKITDLHDGTPIVDALVMTNQEGKFAQSDEEGNYFIRNLCAGKITLEISHVACETQTKSIALNSHFYLNIDLEHHINSLDEIVVVDHRKKEISESVQQFQIEGADMERSSGESLATALERISGVSTLKTGNAIAKPIIHGMFGSRVGIVNNGIRLQDQEWGADHAPSLDINAFESIQLIKGAAALKYGGDTAGGTILLSPFSIPVKDTLYGRSLMNAATNGRGGNVATQLTRAYVSGFFMKFQGSYQQFGDFHAPDYELLNTGLKAANLSMRLGLHRFNSGWEIGFSRYQNTQGILRASHIGNLEDLLNALEAPVPLRTAPFSYAIGAPKQEGFHQNLYASGYFRLTTTTKINLDYSFQTNNRQEFDIRRSGLSDLPAIDMMLKTHSWNASIAWKEGMNWSFEAGLNAVLQDNFSDPATGVKRLIPDYLKYQAGSYFVSTYKPNNQLAVDAGIRLDVQLWDAQKYYNRSDWLDQGYDQDYAQSVVLDLSSQLLANIEKRFLTTAAHAGLLLISKKKEISNRFSYVHTQRAPNASELFSDGLHHSLATVEYGNLRLNKEISHKLIFDVGRDKNTFRWNIAPYFAYTTDFIFIAPQGLIQTVRGAFPVWKYEATDTRIFGGDTSIEWQFNKHFRLTNDTAYIHAQDLNSQTPLISIPPFNSKTQLVAVTPNQKWEWRLSHLWVAQQHRFPDDRFDFPLLVDGQIQTQQIDLSTPPKGYQLFSMDISIFLGKLHSKNFIVRMMGNNIFNTAYIDYLNRLRYYSFEKGRNFHLQLIFNY